MSVAGDSNLKTRARARAKLRRRARSAAWMPVLYAKEFKLKGVDRPIMLAARLWSDSLATRVGLILLVLGTGAAAWLLSRDPEARALTDRTADVTALVFLGGAWAGAVGFTATWPLWGFGMASIYFIYFSLLPGAPLWARTPMLAVPTLWLLFVGAWIFRSTRPRHVGHVVVWGMVCWGAAWVSVGPLRVRDLVGKENEPVGVAILTILFFIAGCLFAGRNKGRKTRQKSTAELEGLPRDSDVTLFCRIERRFDSVPTYGIVAGISLCLLVFYWGSSVVVMREESLALARDVTSQVLGQVDLLWMGLAGGFLLGAAGVGRWTTRMTYDICSPRLARWLWPATWAFCALASWIAFWSTSAPATWVMMNLGLMQWRNDLGFAAYWAGYCHGVVSVTALLVLLTLTLRRRATPRAVATINALWAGAYLGLAAWFATSEKFAASATGPTTFQAFWPALVLLGGILWSMGKTQRNWFGVSRRSLQTPLALMALVLGLAVSPAGIGTVNMFGVQALATLVGMTHLGIPRLIQSEVLRGRRLKPPLIPTGAEMLALFAIGAVMSVPMLILDHDHGWHLLLVIPILCATLLVARHRRPRWVALAGASAGGAVMIGFAWGWWFPPAYEIPFIEPWRAIRQSWVDPPILRWRFSWEHVHFVLTATAIGAATGWAVFGSFRHQAKKRIELS